jgi:hypothetical protein
MQTRCVLYDVGIESLCAFKLILVLKDLKDTGDKHTPEEMPL